MIPEINANSVSSNHTRNIRAVLSLYTIFLDCLGTMCPAIVAALPRLPPTPLRSLCNTALTAPTPSGCFVSDPSYNTVCKIAEG